MSQNIGSIRAPRHLMGVTTNPSIYGIQNMYPHHSIGTYRHGQPHQIITLVNPQNPYQCSGRNGHLQGPPYYMPSSPSSPYSAVTFGHQAYLPGPRGPGPGYFFPEVTEPCSHPSFDRPYGIKREKKVMKIIDPNTGINVIEELTGHTSSSADSVLSVPDNNEETCSSYIIAAQFAAQVAATLTVPMGNKENRQQSSSSGLCTGKNSSNQPVATVLEGDSPHSSKALSSSQSLKKPTRVEVSCSGSSLHSQVTASASGDCQIRCNLSSTAPARDSIASCGDDADVLALGTDSLSVSSSHSSITLGIYPKSTQSSLSATDTDSAAMRAPLRSSEASVTGQGALQVDPVEENPVSLKCSGTAETLTHGHEPRNLSTESASDVSSLSTACNLASNVSAIQASSSCDRAAKMDSSFPTGVLVQRIHAADQGDVELEARVREIEAPKYEEKASDIASPACANSPEIMKQVLPSSQLTGVTSSMQNADSDSTSVSQLLLSFDAAAIKENEPDFDSVTEESEGTGSLQGDEYDGGSDVSKIVTHSTLKFSEMPHPCAPCVPVSCVPPKSLNLNMCFTSKRCLPVVNTCGQKQVGDYLTLTQDIDCASNHETRTFPLCEVQRKASDRIDMKEEYHRGLVCDQKLRDVRKRTGPLSRPMSKERLSSEGQSPTPLEEDEVAHLVDSEMFINEHAVLAGGHFPGPVDYQQDYGSPASQHGSSPGENSRYFDGVTEHRRNRANLQMNQRSRTENDSHTLRENSAKVMESSRSKQPKLEGRIQYDRNFLLQLQFEPESLQRPPTLPSLPEIILDAPVVRNERTTNSSSTRKSFNDFTPNFARPNPVFPIRSPGAVIPSPLRMPTVVTGPGRTIVRRFSHSKEPQLQPPRKVIQVSLQQNVQLHTAENAWKPVHKKDSIETDLQNEELYRRIRGILNKLTPQKFQTLIQQVHELDINTEEKLKGCIDLIFEKAISEPNFSVAYANMAKCLINLKVPTEDNPAEPVTFRKLLLNRCQREFEKDKLEEIDLEHMQSLIDMAETGEKKRLLIEEKERAEAKSKKRSLGNIRFIGELYKLKMLTENIMHDCIIRLLRYSHDEDNLECLSRLLTTIGQDIDNEKSRSRVDQYMHQLRKIIDNRKICSRIKFMLQDLMELRKNGWVPRREDNKPKTIKQIHKEAEQEEQQKQALLQRTSQEQRSSYRRPRTPSLLSGSVSEEGWRGALNVTVDPTRMKLTKHQVEDIQLGPGGRPGYSTWQRGSSGGGSRTPSLEREKPPRHGTNDNYEYRNYSRTMPRGKGLAMRSMEKDRNAAIAAVRSIAAGNLGESRVTPTNSRNASRDSSCTRETTRGSHGSSEFMRGSVELGRVPIILSRRSNDLGRSGSESVGSSLAGHNNGSVEVDSVGNRSGDDVSLKTDKCSEVSMQEMSQKEIEKKSKSILEEYLHLCDLEEASFCMKELRSSKAVTFFITEAINFALERSFEERKHLGRLLAHLVKKKHCTLDHLTYGFQEVLDYAEDMEIDIPKIWQYLGELMAMTVMDGSIPLRLLKNFCKPLTNLEKSSLVVAVIIEIITENMGKEKVQLMWQESQLLLKNFVPANKLDHYIRSQNLGWLESSTTEPGANALSSEMDKMILMSDTANEDVISWITANVSSSAVGQSQFIRALMTAVCKSTLTASGKNYEVVVDRLKHRGPLLMKYLGRNADLEVQALYALQNVVHNLEHPPNILRVFFNTLYDEDIISEEAFNQWYNCDDPHADQLGKGVAKSSVNHFYMWLHGEEQ